MRKFIFLFIATAFLVSAAYAAESQIWGEMRIANILGYGKEGTSKLGPLFVMLQSQYFAKIFLGILIGVPAVFLLHYLLIGAKVFSHDGKKIFVFSVFKRAIHWLAALAFIILIPTGFMIVFGKYLGGGSIVENARHLHGVATVMFAVSVVPMFLFWIKDMLPTTDDIKWMFILGGYLSKEVKEIPAGKFNAGQKMWFWLATLGGIVMIATGAVMYMQDFDFGIAKSLGMSQIDLLRFVAIVHNVLAFAVVALFFTHVYMSMFAIKGALYSMISGYKEEDEVKYLHSTFYKKLKSKGEI
jgi:formate dehydrogenase subunit gamma